MRIIGCDLHARQQTLAMLDTITGEMVNLTLMHEGNGVREFYSQLPRPVLVGIEATGSMQWFLNLMDELGIECQVGHPATIRAAEPRKQKHDRRDADLILKLLAEQRFPAIWLPSKELLDLRALLLHRHQWVRIRTRIQNALQAIALANGLRRGPGLWSYDGQAKIAFLPFTPCLLSTQRAAGHVQEDGRGNREPDPTSRRASWPTFRSAIAHDAPRSGAGHGPGDGGIPRRSEAIRGWQGPGQLCGDHPAGIFQWTAAAARWSDQTRQSAVAVSLV
jgi:Transposase